MNILFNREGDSKAATEIKEQLSFIDIDIKYKNIKSDILSATRELIAIVGKEVYDVAYDDYSNKTDAKTDLVNYLRYPIAINAYRMYAPNNDIAHTANGRKMRQDDNQKQAFEWMIDRDNEMLERKYYRAVDDLLHYLEENETDWKTSAAYKKLQESIFKTTDDFNEHFKIDSRLLLLQLTPGIKQCVQFEMKSRVPATVLNSIVNNNAEPQNQELQFMIKQACAFYAMAWAMPRLSVRLFPQGILQSYVGDRSTTQAKQVPSGNALAYAKQYFEDDFKKAIAKIETIVKASQPVSDSDFIDDTFTGSNFIST